MSKRSGKTGTRPPSVAGKKSSVTKGPEECSKCSKPNKSLKKLPCDHTFCPDCVTTLVVIPAPAQDGRASKMSKAGGKRIAPPPKDEYECILCNPPPPVESKYGDCAPCKFEEKTSPAVGFCLECADLLCESCCSEHNKFKTIRAHNILKGQDIPKDTGAVASLPMVMHCVTHPDKDLEYYCVDHEVMGCGACVNIGHRRCERVMFIKDITDSTSDRRIVADAAVELREIRKTFEEINKDTGDIVANLENQRTEIRERRDGLKNKIMELLDKLETSSELEMEETIQKVSKDIDDGSSSSTDIMEQIDSSIQVLNAAAAHATDLQLFVAGKRSSSDRDKFTNILNNAMGGLQNVRLDYKPDPTLQRFINSLELFEGRCITSSSTSAGQKPKNVFEPRNGFIDRPQRNNFVNPYQQQQQQQQMHQQPQQHYQRPQEYGEMPTMHREIRPVSDQMDQLRYQAPLSNGAPTISQRSQMYGSVPDFRNTGMRSSSSDLRSVVSADFTSQSYSSTNGYQSLPQSPNRLDNGMMNKQSRSMPPTPRLGDVNRPQLSRKTFYERQTYGDSGALPMINQRGGTRSEPGFPVKFPDAQRQDFSPKAPRIVGNNSLVNQSGSVRHPQPVSQVDILTLNQNPTLQRKDSVLSQISTNSSLPPPAAKPPRSDILAQASPIKRRSELNTTNSTALKERRAVLAGQFNVRLPEDAAVCGLKGMAILSDGRIALADYDNHNVKLFDSKLYRGMQLKLSSGPWDITVTGQKELAVSLPFESKIQFVQVGDHLKATRAIKMDMDCYGIVCNNQELIVVCNDYLIGPAIQVISMTGRVKQTIDIDRDGNRILIDPYYLAVTPTGKQIYVSDKDRIVCMDRHGNVTSVYQEQSMRNARGLDMDPEGNLYVCGYMSNSVHQITVHGIDFRTLIGKNHLYDPWSVIYNATGGTLLVTCDQTDMVQIFSLQ